MKQVLVVGGVNFDLTAHAERLPRSGETLLAVGFDQQAGGKASNQAVASSAWGMPTRLLARIGSDSYADAIEKQWHAVGLKTDLIIRDEAGTGLGIVFMDRAGAYQTLVVPRANANLQPADLELVDMLWSDVGLLVLQLESPLETVTAAAWLARQRGVPVLLNAAPADRFPDTLWALLTILIVNEVEAHELTGIMPLDWGAQEQALSALLERVPCAVITLGGAGVVAQTRGHAPIALPGLDVPVVSTLGAGDAFVGVFSAEWAQHGDLTTALRHANEAAAVSVTQSATQFTLNHAAVLERLTQLGLPVSGKQRMLPS